MAENTFQRKAVYFLIFAGVITILVLLLPAVQDIFESYLLAQFGLSIGAEGKLISADGSTPGMMSQTTFDLAINLFHIIKIVLWMALVIAVVRFVGLLIFATAMRRLSSTYSETSSP